VRRLLLQNGRTTFGLVVNGLRHEQGTYDYEYAPASGSLPGVPIDDPVRVS
jgi:hypothetical protein